MGDTFAAIGAVVDHESETVGEAEVGGDFLGGEEEMTEDRLVCGSRFTDAGDEFFGDD